MLCRMFDAVLLYVYFTDKLVVVKSVLTLIVYFVLCRKIVSIYRY